MINYVSWNKNIIIKRYNNGIETLFLEENLSNNRENLILNKTASEILKIVNGLHTLNEIIKIFSEKYCVDEEEVSNNIIDFTNFLKEEYGIIMISKDEKYETNVKIEDDLNYYPKVATIELTYKCNLNCIHCYGNYGDKKDTMNFESAIKLIDELNDMGVSIIELTGGDVSIYPYLCEIIEHSLELNFDKIIVLTNGYNLNSNFINICIQNSERIVLQIDLHSLNEDYLFWFTKHKNILPQIKENIIKLTSNFVNVRIAIIITQKNYKELNEIVEWAKDNKAESVGMSLVVKMGRAEDAMLYIEEEDMLSEVDMIIHSLNSKYPSYINVIVDGKGLTNCGFLSSNIVINPKGEIKICTMDSGNNLNNLMLNAIDTSIKSVFDMNKDIFADILKIQAPKIQSESCKDCEHKFFCSNCVLRGIMKSREIGSQCGWIKYIRNSTLFGTIIR